MISDFSSLSRLLVDGRVALETNTPEETQEVGRRLGAAINGPLVITLAGDLGSGKTCFTRGLARGLGVDERYPVTSPTYTIVNEYPGRLPLFHLDLYRLGSCDELEEIGSRDMLQEGGVIVVEWPERADEHELGAHLAIAIAEREGDNRKISFISCDEKVDLPILF